MMGNVFFTSHLYLDKPVLLRFSICQTQPKLLQILILILTVLNVFSICYLNQWFCESGYISVKYYRPLLILKLYLHSCVRLDRLDLSNFCDTHKLIPFRNPFDFVNFVLPCCRQISTFQTDPKISNHLPSWCRRNWKYLKNITTFIFGNKHNPKKCVFKTSAIHFTS